MRKDAVLFRTDAWRFGYADERGWTSAKTISNGQRDPDGECVGPVRGERDGAIDAAGTHTPAAPGWRAGPVQYRQVPSQTCVRHYRNLAARLCTGQSVHFRSSRRFQADA